MSRSDFRNIRKHPHEVLSTKIHQFKTSQKLSRIKGNSDEEFTFRRKKM